MKGEQQLFSPDFWPFIDGSDAMQLLKIGPDQLKNHRRAKKVSTYTFDGTGKLYYNVLEMRQDLFKHVKPKKKCCCAGCKLHHTGVYKLPVPWLPDYGQ